MTNVEAERAAIECLHDIVNQIPKVLRHTKYRAVGVTLNGDGGWQIEYSVDRLEERGDHHPRKETGSE